MMLCFVNLFLIGKNGFLSGLKTMNVLVDRRLQRKEVIVQTINEIIRNINFA